MRKRIFVVILFLVVVSLIFSVRIYALNIDSKIEVPKLQIPVISDIHIKYQNQEDRFIAALKDYENIAPNYKAIALVGDITEDGSIKQYREFMSLLDTYGNKDSEKIITMGNHEYAEIWRGKIATDKTYLDRFVKETKMTSVYFDKWIEGYHFITLAGEELNSSNGNDAILSDEQYQWLERTLPINETPNKPIFVFLHQQITNTVYGSEFWHGNLNDGRLFNILKKHPQVILFSGHSHNLVDHPRTVYQDGFTMVNTGSVAYTWYNGGNGPDNLSQGLLVNVYEDRVEIKSREFSNRTWLKTFTIQIPFKQTVYDDEKPNFKQDSKINIKNITSTSGTLSLTSAQDNTQVDGYLIKVNGKILKTDYIKYWENNETGTYETTLAGLEPNTKYTVEVYAIDAWMNKSENSVTINFKTPKLAG